MSDCCSKPKPEPVQSSCCATEDTVTGKRKPDYLLRICGGLVLAGYLLHLAFGESGLPAWLAVMSHGIYELINRMWWGIIMAVLFVGLLERIPRELVMSALGQGGSFKGICRATLAGVLLDLCSHGILMVGMKLYERGASLGQVMAFLIASPWNSLSLTIILVALIGLGWTLLFILLSMVVGIISGLLFDRLVAKQVLPASPHTTSDRDNQPVLPMLRSLIKQADYSLSSFKKLVVDGVKDSQMVFRWLFFGIVLATAIRAFVPVDTYQGLFGPTVAGLMLTLLFATIIEVCSEGSAPIAADLMTRAAAPGNSFTFLMAGVSTDYTEVMVLKDTTKSWKIALYLPLLTLPQILVLGWVLNQFALT